MVNSTSISSAVNSGYGLLSAIGMITFLLTFLAAWLSNDPNGMLSALLNKFSGGLVLGTIFTLLGLIAEGFER